MASSSSLAGVTPGLSLQLINFSATDPGGWGHLLERARAADRAGVDRLVVSDHVVFGEHLEAYARAELGGTEGGKQPTGPDGHWLEPMTVLSVLAGLTAHARLATGILVAALRRPVVLAKAAATLDVLSQGRLDLGVGVGWQREEYEAAGLDFDGRGPLLDHTLAVCQTLWRDSPARFESDELRFESIHCMPHPVQAGGVPIWVSGTVNRRVIDRLARFGSGWIPWGPAARDLTSSIVEVRDALAAAGRDPTGLQVTGSLPTATGPDGKPDLGGIMDVVPALVDAGVTDFRIGLRLPEDPAAVTDHLSEVVGLFRAAVGRRQHVPAG
jgi:probable F420-dependent oxidoreductase